jgi:hypothetical protein
MMRLGFPLLALLAACSGEPDAPKDTGAPADTDTAADTDTGVPADTDTDTGTETDADTSDTDTGRDTDTGISDTETDADTSDRDTVRDTDTACDRDDCADTSASSDTAGDTAGADTDTACDRDDCADTSASPDTTGDTAPADTGDPADTAGDTAPADTGTPADTTGDTAPADTGDPADTAGDTAPADTGTPADTGDPADTAAFDTGAPDTVSDTAPFDTGAATDAEVLVATYADWSAGTGALSLWDWPAATSILSELPRSNRDNAVDCDGDAAFLLARNTGTNDTVTALDLATGALGDTWTLDVDAYPWDIARIDGLYWVSLNQACRVDLHDATGAVTETIDLAPFTDDDGTCRPGGLWERGDVTYLLLTGDDRDATVGTPQLLAFDTATRTVDWALSLSGSVASSIGGHVVGDLAYVQNAGTYNYGMTVTGNLDGGFEIVDLATGTTSGFVLAEEDFGVRFDSFSPIAGTATGWLVTRDLATDVQTVEFADLDAGTLTTAFTVTDGAIRRLTVDDDGTFWLLEEDDASGATRSAWVRRDDTFAELERFDLGEDLFQMRICPV